ncbi:MAG: hypothetical protein ACRCZP_01860 [Phycicoccus sp.]
MGVTVMDAADEVLRCAFELSDRQERDENGWQQQARGLAELGYAIVRAEDAARLAWLRSDRTVAARERVCRWAGLLRQGAPFASLRITPEAAGATLAEALDERWVQR